MTEELKPEAVAKAFFDAIERGDVQAVAGCYADDAVIWHNTDGLETSKAENIAVLTNFVAGIPVRRYEDRRLAAFPGGFVQQHVLRLELPDGRKKELPACLVCEVKDGKITRLDEYFDSAQVAALRS